MNELVLGMDQETTQLDRRGRQTIDLTQEVTTVFNMTYDQESDGYLKETPSQVLSREYLIQNNVTFVQGTTSAFRPYSLITSVYPLVINYLRGFRFIKTGVRIRIVPNSTPSQYGVMAVSWAPDVAETDTSHQWINNNPMLLDITNAEGLDFVIPYISIYDRYELFVGEGGPGPTVFTNVLGVQVTDSTVEAPTYNVYASFYDPVVVGAIAQSGRTPTLDSLEQAGEGILALSTLVAPEITLPVAAALEGYQLVKGMYSALKTNYEEVEIEKKERDLTYVRQHSYGPMAHGVYAPAVSMDIAPRVHRLPAHLGETRLMHNILDICKIPTICQVFPFTSTDSTTSFTAIRHEPLNKEGILPWAYTTYMDMFANVFRLWRGSTKIRFYFYTSPLITATFAIYLYNPDGRTLSTSTLDTYAFRKVVNVRGSTIVSISIPFISKKQYIPTVHSGIVGPPEIMSVRLRMLKAPNQIGDNTGKVFLVTAVSAGEDFQFCSPRSPQARAPFSVVEAQSIIREDWGQFENMAGETSVYTRLSDLYEDKMTVEELSMRYSNRVNSAANFGLRARTIVFKDIDLFDWVQQMFRYVRGSIRFKVRCDVPNPYAYMDPGVIGTSILNRYAGNGYVTNALAQNEVLDFELPYVASTTWVRTLTYGTSLDPLLEEEAVYGLIHETSFTPTEVYVGAGADYQLSTLLAPLPYQSFPAFLS